MGLPLHHLPVLQNWDCHVTGNCCKEYLVTISDEEKQRILNQNWDRDRDLGGLEPFRKTGPIWARRTHLNSRPDGSCVFLGETGRCRIHERFGYETKPLPCRLFPFILIPTGDHWRVGLRFACPSAAANKGRALPEHNRDLAIFAGQLADREKLQPLADGSLTKPPRLDVGQKVSWSDLLRIVDSFVNLLKNRKDSLERRWRKSLVLVDNLRKTDLRQITGSSLGELLRVMELAVEPETPAIPHMIPPPTWIGRVLFRLNAALYTRKDYGPNRGLVGRGRLALLRAAWNFTRGSGAVPRLHGWIPEADFARAEEPRGPLNNKAEEVLERYYTVKVGSVQFCGAASFGLSFWEGLESLALTLPVILWVARLYRDMPQEEAVTRAVTIVDDHFGFNRALGSLRQRIGMRILAKRGELARLIAWYAR